MYVADASDFHGQFGDDRHGAYDMEDRMNEFAARERDQVIDDLLAALAKPEPPGAAARVMVALDALGARRLGPYDQRAVAGALWQLGKLLESASASAAVGGGDQVAGVAAIDERDRCLARWGHG
ncbi:MAG: hypothetical protein IPH72_33140 [Sandaracinaceae bacterium]|nr:hypothetical protein [Sandaracinaceae bacterium]